MAPANPARDSRSTQSLPRSTRAQRNSGSRIRARALPKQAAAPRNVLRVIRISELRCRETVYRRGGVPQLLIRRIAVACLHFGDEPAVVTGLIQSRADRGPVIVTQKNIGVDTLVAGPAAMSQHIFQVNARDPRAVNLDPLLGEAGVVDIADVQV